MNLFTRKEWKQRENGLGDTEGEGKGGMNWESGIDIYTL